MTKNLEEYVKELLEEKAKLEKRLADADRVICSAYFFTGYGVEKQVDDYYKKYIKKTDNNE